MEKSHIAEGLWCQGLHHGGADRVAGDVCRAGAALCGGHGALAASGTGGGQVHPVRGTTGRAAGSGLWHLSLYHVLQHHRRLRAHRRRAAHGEDRSGGGRGEGLLLLRGRGSLHLRVVRRRRGQTPGGRSGIRRQDRASPPGGTHRSGGHPLRRGGTGCHQHRPDQAGYPQLHEGDPRLRRL